MRPHQPHWLTLYFLLTIPLPTFAEAPEQQIPIQLASHEGTAAAFSRLPVANNTHIVLTIDRRVVEGTRRWELAQQLVRHLIKSNWLKAVVYADWAPPHADKCETYPVTLSFGNPWAIPAEQLNVLNEAELSGIPITGWSQPSVYGRGYRHLFYQQYPEPVSYHFGPRYQKIRKTIGDQGTQILLQAFGHSMSKMPGGPCQDNMLINLDAQFCQDEDLVFSTSNPGTLIILPQFMHASRHAGITAHFNAPNSENKAISLYVSERSYPSFFHHIEKEFVVNAFKQAFPTAFLKQDILNPRLMVFYDGLSRLTTEDFQEAALEREQEAIPGQQKQALRSFDPLPHFDYWLYPAP